MGNSPKSILTVILAALFIASPARAAKPLKVFILAGQSNMVGMGSVSTFPAIGMDPKTAPMLQDMQDKDGNPVVCENVCITRAGYGDKIEEKSGKLDVTYGGGMGTRIGPEYSFGIYAHKMLGEPILIIKTAWGGKSLNTDFRPPSAGPCPIPDEKLAAMEKAGKDIAAAKAEQLERTGLFYRMMIDHIKKVLKDPKAVHPDYDPEAGYELAGFAWFQGYNDYIGGYYPYTDESLGKNSPKDYSEYSSLLGCFIRDIRKDLSVPELPFVVGVFGMDGKEGSQRIVDFRKAQAATAELPELNGNVVNVFTENYWPEEISRLKAREMKIMTGRTDLAPELAETLKAYRAQLKIGKKSTSAQDARRQAREQAKPMKEKIMKALFTPDELNFLEVGVSQQSYHYWGSAKFYAQAGKGFAEALVGMNAK